jgi:benzodiazapine receptor
MIAKNFMDRKSGGGVMQQKFDWKYFFVFLLIPLAVGAGSAFLTKNRFTLYQSLEHPPGAPPAVVYPIVWCALYILMGISSYCIYKTRHPNRETALLLYCISLLVNFFWPIIFFRMQLYGVAFVWLVLLILLVGILSVLFYRIKRAAFFLILPYVVWLFYAAYLNYGIYSFNAAALF